MRTQEEHSAALFAVAFVEHFISCHTTRIVFGWKARRCTGERRQKETGTPDSEVANKFSRFEI